MKAPTEPELTEWLRDTERSMIYTPEVAQRVRRLVSEVRRLRRQIKRREAEEAPVLWP